MGRSTFRMGDQTALTSSMQAPRDQEAPQIQLATSPSPSAPTSDPTGASEDVERKLKTMQNSIQSLTVELARQKVSLHTTQEATTASQSDLATCRGTCREHHVAIGNLFSHLSNAEAKIAALKQETSQLVDRLNAMAHGINQFETRIAGAQYQLKEQVNFHSAQQVTRMDNFQNSIVGPLFSAFQHLLMGDSTAQANPRAWETDARGASRQLSTGLQAQRESVAATSSVPSPVVAATTIATTARSLSHDSNAPLAEISRSLAQTAPNDLSDSRSTNAPLSCVTANTSGNTVDDSGPSGLQASNNVVRPSTEASSAQLQPQDPSHHFAEGRPPGVCAVGSEPVQPTPSLTLSHPSASPSQASENRSPPAEHPANTAAEGLASRHLPGTMGTPDQVGKSRSAQASPPLKRKRTPSIEFLRTQFAKAPSKQGPLLPSHVAATSTETIRNSPVARSSAPVQALEERSTPRSCLRDSTTAIPFSPPRSGVRVEEQAAPLAERGDTSEAMSGGQAMSRPSPRVRRKVSKPVATSTASRQQEGVPNSLEPVVLKQVARSGTISGETRVENPQQTPEQALPSTIATVSTGATPTEPPESSVRAESSAAKATSENRPGGTVQGGLQQRSTESAQSSVIRNTEKQEPRLREQSKPAEPTPPSAPQTAPEPASAETARAVQAEADLSRQTRVDEQHQTTRTTEREESALGQGQRHSPVQPPASSEARPPSRNSTTKALLVRTSTAAARTKSQVPEQREPEHAIRASPKGGKAEPTSVPHRDLKRERSARLPERPNVACRASPEKQQSWIQYFAGLSSRSLEVDLHDPYYIWAYLGGHYPAPLVITQNTFIRISLVSANLADTLAKRNLATVFTAGEDKWLEVGLGWFQDARGRNRSSDGCFPYFSAERCIFLVVPNEYMKDGIVLAEEDLLRLELEIDARKEISSRAFLAVRGRIAMGSNLMALPSSLLRSELWRPFKRICDIAEYAMTRKDIPVAIRRAWKSLQERGRNRDEAEWWRDSKPLYETSRSRSRSRECTYRSPEPRLSERISDRLHPPPSLWSSEPPSKRQRVASATTALDTGSPLSELSGEEVEEDELRSSGEEGQIAPQTYQDLTPRERDECLRRTRQLLEAQKQRRERRGAAEPASKGLSLLGSSARAKAAN